MDLIATTFLMHFLCILWMQAVIFVRSVAVSILILLLVDVDCSLDFLI